MAVDYVSTFFLRFYDVKSIIDSVQYSLNDRKVSYNAIVSFLQYNRPASFTDSDEFLYHCFDDGEKKKKRNFMFLMTLLRWQVHQRSNCMASFQDWSIQGMQKEADRFSSSLPSVE